MMKKMLAVVLALCMTLALIGCGNAKQPENEDQSSGESKRVEPLASSVDVSNVTEATLAVSFDKSSLHTDGDTMTLDMKVYDFEQFDAAEVSQLKEGDVIVVDGKEITVASIDTTNGVEINGGFGQENGVSLATLDGGVLCAVGADDAKSYYEVGTVTLPVSETCVLTDSADLSAGEKTVAAAELAAFLTNDTAAFQPGNTQVTVSGGQITAISRVYMP